MRFPKSIVGNGLQSAWSQASLGAARVPKGGVPKDRQMPRDRHYRRGTMPNFFILVSNTILPRTAVRPRAILVLVTCRDE
jgi:hypothetical protein